MKRRIVWLVTNSDVALALSVAIVVAVLGVVGPDSEKAGPAESATLATLAVLAVILLRDRARNDQRDQDWREALAETQLRLDRLADGIDRSSGVYFVIGLEFGKVLAAARQSTDRWLFKGATGTYVRAVTLPECVDHARLSRRALVFRLEILDPTDPELCERYVRMHQRLTTRADSPEHSWTMDETRRELFATILAACWYQQRYEMLDIDIGLSSKLSIHRYELSSRCLIITQRGPSFPATIVESGNLSYDLWNTELAVSLRQSKLLPMKQIQDVPLSASPSADEVRSVFSLLGVALPDTYTDADLEEISELALASANPYE
ncbi:hypothetical protein GCM10009555_028430 [Acrocarpospora macrocephala]|uniref:Uncharacterized protein n=1 Tax=Acrocarpospora macrocephala TaxID=150177 RepID=A0A5M3XCS6_9ACTN|nr:hypothetical protein [Acrocarpospora macrocephala]GES15858.1 hypothetical protein Amac_094560 [Acrocarpospora macrocephala]